MKAVEYFNKYHNLIMTESLQGGYDALVDLFDDVYFEITTICKIRNAVKSSAIISAVKEVNQKWNKICDMFIQKYKVCPLKRDAIKNKYIKLNPDSEIKFNVGRQDPYAPFDGEKAKSEFDMLSQTEKMLITFSMLGKAYQEQNE